MRENKFRAWDSSEKEMVDWPSLKNDPDDWLIGLLRGEEDSEDALMQFIGRLDKNGKEIYEGDICKGYGGDFLGVVEWRDELSWECGGSIHPGFYFSICKDELDYGVGFMGCEVIGNIYENPELLKTE